MVSCSVTCAKDTCADNNCGGSPGNPGPGPTHSDNTIAPEAWELRLSYY